MAKYISLSHLWPKHVSKPGPGAFQSQTSDEEDGQDDVRKHGREVHDLAGALDALHDDEVDNDPGAAHAEKDPPFDTAKVIDRGGDVQGGAVPKVLRLRGLGALGDRDVGGSVGDFAVVVVRGRRDLGTVCPWKRRLKGIF